MAQKKERYETQFRLYCRPWGFILGSVIYLCYVGWFGCLFANFRCNANVVPMWAVQEDLSGHYKTSTAVKFSWLFPNQQKAQCFEIWIFQGCHATLQLVCVLKGVHHPVATKILRNPQCVSRPQWLAKHMWTCTLQRQSQSDQMLETHIHTHARHLHQLMNQSPFHGLRHTGRSYQVEMICM